MAADSHVFHKALIGGLNFYATMSGDGPYIGCKEGGGVAIGHCTSIEKHKDLYDERGFSYSICKYRNQVRIVLRDFTEKEIQQLSQEFGIPVGYRSTDHNETFRFSPAFKRLVVWARKHPRLFARYRRLQNYLLWADMVDKQLVTASTADALKIGLNL